MGVGAGLYMYVVVVQKFTFAISSPDEFLYQVVRPLGRKSVNKYLYLLKIYYLRCSAEVTIIQRGTEYYEARPQHNTSTILLLPLLLQPGARRPRDQTSGGRCLSWVDALFT